MKKQIKPKIDPEFAGLLPRQHPEELAQLKADIEMNGLRDDLVVWEETGILLDGHTRLSICEGLGINYRYQTISFPDRQEAIDWVYNNQLARRNVAKDERAILIAKRVKALKEQAEKAKKDSQNENSQSENSETTTAEIVGKVAASEKVSAATVYRDVAKVASNFCERCVRIGTPVKNCPKCAAKQSAKPKRKKKAASEKGKVLIDWTKFRSSFGVVVRISDEMNKHYPKILEPGERKEYERHVAVLTALWQGWEKRIK